MVNDVIRAYEAKDLDTLLEVWYSASKVGHPFLSEAFFEEERHNIATLYLPKAETWVYEREGEVIGYMSLLGNEVGGLFVAAAQQRQGIGAALLDHAMQNRTYLELEVFEDNLIGRKFYEAYGFQEVSRYFHEEIGFMMLCVRLDVRHKTAPNARNLGNLSMIVV